MAQKSPSAMYDAYTATRSRTVDDGLLVIPVAGPKGTPPKIVRVHGGVETETVDFSAQRIGAYPEVPHPEIQDPNIVFLGGTQAAPAPMVQQTGTYTWNIAGQYTYVHRNVIGLAGDLPVPSMPFDTTTAEGNTIPANAFDKTIIGSSSPRQPELLNDNIIPRRP